MYDLEDLDNQVGTDHTDRLICPRYERFDASKYRCFASGEGAGIVLPHLVTSYHPPWFSTHFQIVVSSGSGNSFLAVCYRRQYTGYCYKYLTFKQ